MKESPGSAPEAAGPGDWVLMKRAARGCEDSYRTLAERYQGPLLNLFRRMGASWDEAEDALQETFARLHAFRGRAEPTGSFRTLIYTMARRAWIDQCRRKKRQRRIGGHGAEDPERHASPPGMDPGDRLDLEEALSKLPEGHRLVIVLSTTMGLKYEEIAKIMDIPEGTVKSRVFHALRKLRASMTHVRKPVR